MSFSNSKSFLNKLFVAKSHHQLLARDIYHRSLLIEKLNGWRKALCKNVIRVDHSKYIFLFEINYLLSQANYTINTAFHFEDNTNLQKLLMLQKLNEWWTFRTNKLLDMIFPFINFYSEYFSKIMGYFCIHQNPLFLLKLSLPSHHHAL